MTTATASTFDELNRPDGNPRPGWAPLWAYLNTHSHSQLEYAHQQVQRELAEQEITGSAVDFDEAEDRLWQLDSLPFVLALDEWQHLAQGLSQRAQVLECVLQDLYGDRRLFSQPWFPTALVCEHPNYIRAATELGQRRLLHCYSADVVRGVDGHWRVLADRCQAPYGLGYALQNRLVIGRSLPDLFQQTHVQALAPFFNTLITRLRDLHPNQDPRMVLFGSQRHGDTSYEQAFLARYLDIDLATAEDLTVRDRRLWLKTLGGLVPVDIALRFVDDSWTDPLNLRPDSLVGVPGLVDAVQAGNLILANGLGSGVIDSPGLLSTIEQSSLFLGCGELTIPSVPSAWGGQGLKTFDAWGGPEASALLSVAHGLRQKPAFLDRAPDEAARGTIREHLLRRPQDYAGFARLHPSTAPVWDDGVLAHQPMVVRMYLVADADGGFIAMPGGLVRCDHDRDFAFYGIRRGGTSKDLWVPAGAPQTSFLSPVMPYQRGITQRAEWDLPSSRLDDLFWFGRTCEGLDHRARLLRVAVGAQRSLLWGERERGPSIVDRLCHQYADTKPKIDRPAIDRIQNLVFAMAPATSVCQQVDELARLARRTRAYLSSDTWLLVQDLRRQVEEAGINADARLATVDRLAVRVLAAADAVNGTLGDNMLRDPTWTFVELGRRLQRTILLATVLDLCLGPEVDDADLLAALDLTDSTTIWRTRYGRPPDQEGLLELVGRRDDHPRSLAYQLARIDTMLRSLPGFDADHDVLTQHLVAAHDYLDSGTMPGIKEAMQAMAAEIDLRWFAHALPQRSIDRSQGPG